MPDEDIISSLCLQCGNPISSSLSVCPHCGGEELDVPIESIRIKRIDIGHDNLTVAQARSALEREFSASLKAPDDFLIIVHGHGSSGTGGKIKVMVHDFARSMIGAKRAKDFIKGEDLTRTSSSSKRISSNYPMAKNLKEWNKRNAGLSILVL